MVRQVASGVIRGKDLVRRRRAQKSVVSDVPGAAFDLDGAAFERVVNNKTTRVIRHNQILSIPSGRHDIGQIRLIRPIVGC